MRLRNKPWKMLALLVLGSTGAVAFGIDILDGVVSLRRSGEIRADEHPARFAVVLLGYLVVLATIAFGWFVMRDEWGRDYCPHMKPPVDDPDRIQRL